MRCLYCTELLVGVVVLAQDEEGGESDDEAEQEVEEQDMVGLDQHIREAEVVAAEDEEAAAVQEQIRRIRAEEDEFETFDLKIIHRKNRCCDNLYGS